MKQVIQLVRDGHIGCHIFGRLLVGDNTYLTVEKVDGALDPGKYPMAINENGRAFVNETYPLMSDPNGSFAAAGLRIGLHYAKDKWDITDKATITSYVVSEIAKAQDRGDEMLLEISYRKYGKKV